MALASSTQKITVEAFLSLPESKDRIELVDGEIIMSPKPRQDHQRLIGYLIHLLYQKVGNEGCILVDKEMIVRTPDGQEGVRCPDIVYVQESRAEIARQDATYGGADIAIEILSDGTEEVDRISKRNEYQITGVAEYWIVDIKTRSILIHYFAKGHRALFKDQEEFESKVLKELGFPCLFSIPEVFGILD